MTCTDFCTAAKCAELEARIGALEQALELLEASFQAHTTQPIPDAHSYTPNVEMYLSEYEGTIYYGMCVDSVCVNDFIELSQTSTPPELELYVTKLTSGVGHYEIEIRVDGVSAIAELQVEYPPLELYFEPYYYGNDIEIYLYSNSEIYADTYAEIYLTLDELSVELPPSNLQVALDYSDIDELLTVTVSNSQSSASAGTTIPSSGDTYVTENHYHSGGGGNHIPSNLTLTGSFENEYLTLNVADGESSATAQILFDMNFDECCQQILTAIAEVKSELTIDVAGELVTDYQHEFELDESDDIIPTYAISKSQTKTYEHVGLAGIHELLKVILTNQEQLHLVGTQGISPPVTVDLASTVDGLCSMYDLQTEDDFDDEAGFFDYIRLLVQGQLSNSVSKILLKRIGLVGGLPGMVVSTTADWALGFFIDKLTAQEQIANQSLCDVVENIRNELTIEVTGEILGEFDCSNGENEQPTNKALPYQEKPLSNLHKLLKTTNNNLWSIFQATCNNQIEIAAPSWWQVRLGGNVPQIVCTFRRVGTRTYHSLTIPHPNNINRPIAPLLTEYTKGNYQGMIVLKDNSKFIVNCNTPAEAERVCNQAAALIDPNYLPIPLKIWLTERKGEVVSTDLMKPTSAFYYANGQQNTTPNWRVGLTQRNGS